MPDPTTFAFLPWRAGEKPVARMFCDVLQPDGTPYEGDPRYILKRLIKKMADQGYTCTWARNWSTSISRNNRLPRSDRSGRIFRLRALDMGGNATARNHIRACSPWESVWSTPTTKSPTASTKSTSVTTKPWPWPTRRRPTVLIGKGNRPRPWFLRHLHAQADLRSERQRHAHAPIAVQRWQECLLQSKATSIIFRTWLKATSRES